MNIHLDDIFGPVQFRSRDLPCPKRALYCATEATATKFGQKSAWLKLNAFLGSEVTQGLSGVNQRSNCLEMSYATNISQKNPLPECNTL